MLQLQQEAFKHITSVDPKLKATVCGSFRRGLASSGDIDILLGHPDFISSSGSSNSSPNTKRKSDYVKGVVTAMEKGGFVTETLSLGENKFMVSACRELQV